ncbi:Os04g0607100, partial [Oryza sativa Japonica Group]
SLLILLTLSFISLVSFYDPGPHGNFRYSKHMLPEVRESDFRKGSQWFSVKRQHALMIIADSLYYTKFKLHCKPGMEDGRNCYADEHYLPTLFHMIDPNGIANWSVTHVDWSEGKWHPKAYRANDVTYELLKNITSIDMSYHITSDSKKVVTQRPCLWNGVKRPCYLFARKFYPESINRLMNSFSNYTRF